MASINGLFQDAAAEKEHLKNGKKLPPLANQLMLFLAEKSVFAYDLV